MTEATPAIPPATLTVDDAARIGVVTLRRPARRNALSNEMLERLEQLFGQIHDRPDIRSVVVAAEGTVFSAGRDLREPDPFEESAPLPVARNQVRLGARAMNRLRNLPQLTVAAVQGPAVGGGAVLALACDFRVMAEDAWLHTPEVELGLPLGWDTLPQLVALAGPARAKWLAAGCRRIDARQALAWGFCEEVGSDPLAASIATAAEFAARPRVAQTMVKESINRIAQSQRFPESEADQVLLARDDPEGREARERAIESLRTPR